MEYRVVLYYRYQKGPLVWDLYKVERAQLYTSGNSLYARQFLY